MAFSNTRQATFRRYPATDGLPSGAITSLATADNGALLILTSNGITSFDGTHFSNKSRFRRRYTVLQWDPADDGSIWIASNLRNLSISAPATSAPNRSAHPSSSRHRGHRSFAKPRSLVANRHQPHLLQSGHQRTFEAGRDIPATRIQSILAGSREMFGSALNKGLFVLDQSSSQPKLQPTLGSTAAFCPRFRIEKVMSGSVRRPAGSKSFGNKLSHRAGPL